MKTPDDIARMQALGRVLAQIFVDLERLLKSGVTTKYLDWKAEELMRKHKVTSAFKGYRGYPATVCISVNEEIIHGIPRDDKHVAEGDIVSIDMGIVKDGYYVDAARSYIVGMPARNRIRHLVETTQKALYKGIDNFRVNNRLGDISSAIEQTVLREGFSVVKDFVGHGIGTNLHEEPAIPNCGRPHEGPVLQEGMVFAIEPMVNEGREDVTVLDDGWTAVTTDRTMSAHFEHTVALTKEGAVILTTL